MVERTPPAIRQEVCDQVRRTVIHEVAHHFGIDDRRLSQLGWWDGSLRYTPRPSHMLARSGPAGERRGQGDRHGHDPRLWPSDRNALLALAGDQGNVDAPTALAPGDGG